MGYQEVLKAIATISKDQVKIVAVSKLQKIEKILQLYQLGHRDFAENYVQEAKDKQLQLTDYPEIRWHFIGRIQSNKAKDIVGNFDLIHSVDSLKLLKLINQIAERKGLKQKILVQINLNEEASKGGIPREQIQIFVNEILASKYIEFCGWMLMPPIDADEELLRKTFSEARNIRDSFLPVFPKARELSMGTSHDYLIAIQEGATMIRLGTVLFGERRVEETKD